VGLVRALGRKPLLSLDLREFFAVGLKEKRANRLFEGLWLDA